MTGTAMAQQPKVTSLLSKDLTENPGTEVLVITVDHAPGGSSPIHRHNAQAIVYGMLKQLHPVTSNVHASPAPQNPLHSGASASPHGVVRHSQAPPEVIAEQCPPLPQVPSQRRSSELKSQELGASVVLVVVEPVVPVLRVAGAHRN